MPRRYSVPLAYLRHLESELVLLIAAIGRDSKRGGVIPPDRVDAGATGEALITLETEGELAAMLLEAKREGYALALANTGPQPVTDRARQYYRERAEFRIPDDSVVVIPLPEPLKVAS